MSTTQEGKGVWRTLKNAKSKVRKASQHAARLLNLDEKGNVMDLDGTKRRNGTMNSDSTTASTQSSSAHASYRHLFKHESRFEVDASFLEDLRDHEYKFPRDPSMRYPSTNLLADPWFHDDDEKASHISRPRARSWATSQRITLELSDDEEPQSSSPNSAGDRRSFLASAFRPLFSRKSARRPPPVPEKRKGGSNASRDPPSLPSRRTTRTDRQRPVPPPKPRRSLVREAKEAFRKGSQADAESFSTMKPVLAEGSVEELVSTLPRRKQKSQLLSIRRRSETSQPILNEVISRIKQNDLEIGKPTREGLSQHWSFSEALEAESDDDEDTWGGSNILPGDGSLAVLASELKARREKLMGTDAGANFRNNNKSRVESKRVSESWDEAPTSTTERGERKSVSKGADNKHKTAKAKLNLLFGRGQAADMPVPRSTKPTNPSKPVPPKPPSSRPSKGGKPVPPKPPSSRPSKGGKPVPPKPPSSRPSKGSKPVPPKPPSSKRTLGSGFGGRKAPPPPPEPRRHGSGTKPKRSSRKAAAPPPPPPPSVSSPPQALIGGGGDSGDLSKYEKMLKAGLPEGAVYQKMVMEGVDPSLLGLSF